MELTYDERLQRGFEKLDRDLEFIFGCFREMLESIGEEDVAAALPWGGQGQPRPMDELPDDLALEVIRAQTIAFQLINMVEENAAAQIRRLVEARNGLKAESGLWGRALDALGRDGIAAHEIARNLPFVRVEVVLTAHPTEAKRVTVLEQHRQLYLLLVKRENPMWSPSELAGLRREILAVLERMWRTGQTYKEKPTVEAERTSQLHYFRTVFPEVVDRLDQRLRDAWADAGHDPHALDDPANLPRLRFGTWVGGDRDGHPLVTPEVTEETFRELRRTALNQLRQALFTLGQKLSLSVPLQPLPESLEEAVHRLAKVVGTRARRLLQRNADEPWRQFVALLGARLPLAEAPAGQTSVDLAFAPGSYRTAYELAADLRLLRASLVEVGAARIARAEVDPLLRRVEIFGFHTAALDIRQNSAFHDRAMAQILRAAGHPETAWTHWDEQTRLNFLQQALTSPKPLLVRHDKAGPEAENAVETFAVVARHLDLYGPEGVGCFILSMTRTVSDLFAVFFLAREAGLLTVAEGRLLCRMAVVPLFETIGDLERGPAIMEAFLDHPITRASLEWLNRRSALLIKKGLLDPAEAGLGNRVAERPVQAVMIGYSDSTKDQGIIASQWALRQAQHEISRVAAARSLRIRFFHGRGGTISRGAGPTDRFLEALPRGALLYDLRLTEQGESIAQKYGNQITAIYNLELLLAGVTRFSLHNARLTETPTHRLDPVLDRLADRAGEAYRALIRADGFVPFFRQATPIDALEQARIGSRPSRRTGAATVDDLRAIPWVFAWSQSRYFMPGWYGVGSALAALEAEAPGTIGALADGVRAVPFLRYLFTNVEMTLASADASLMRDYAELVDDAALRERFATLLLAEYERSRTLVGDVLGTGRATRRPRLEKTLALRNVALRPLHHRQIALLRQYRAALAQGDTAKAEALVHPLQLTVSAIASGLRTTG